MAETIKVDPTPIQRNRFDVAMELFQYHSRSIPMEENDIQEVFAKYYALATVCERSSVSDLQNLLDEELVNKIGRFK